MRRAREERGAAFVFVVVFLGLLLAMAAFVVDVGSWFTAQRRLQGAADAATLAAAQELPNTAAATSSATTYADANITGLEAWSPTFPDANTIEITLSKAVPGIFAKVMDVDSVTVHAHARARAGAAAGLKYVAPVAISSGAVCTPAAPSCFGTRKDLRFDESNLSSSSFGLVSLSCAGSSATSCSSSGTGSSDLVNWISSGYPGLLGVNKWYAAVTGEKIGPVRDALNGAYGANKMLLFPVFDRADNTAMSFHVIGWSAFVLDQAVANSEWKNDAANCRPCKVLHGHFTKYIAHGVDIDPTGTNFGVRVVVLAQ